MRQTDHPNSLRSYRNWSSQSKESFKYSFNDYLLRTDSGPGSGLAAVPALWDPQMPVTGRRALQTSSAEGNHPARLCLLVPQCPVQGTSGHTAGALSFCLRVGYSDPLAPQPPSRTMHLQQFSGKAIPGSHSLLQPSSRIPQGKTSWGALKGCNKGHRAHGNDDIGLCGQDSVPRKGVAEDVGTGDCWATPASPAQTSAAARATLVLHLPSLLSTSPTITNWSRITRQEPRQHWNELPA